jgi:hypothetical protein
MIRALIRRLARTAWTCPDCGGVNGCSCIVAEPK